MEFTQRNRSVRRTAALVAATAAVALAIPAAANASVTGAVTGDTATLTGTADPDNIIISPDNGLLKHNLGTATGFAGPTDFDSAQAGTQTLTAAATLTINGGGGDDNIVGGPAADHINGGDGDDRITGFTGDDVQTGGVGNDVFIWNNGDNTDTNDGQDGNDEQVMNGRNTTDDMTIKAIADGRTRFDRAAPGPFGLDMGTIERFSLNLFQGDDKLVTNPDVTLPISVDAGPGNDAITTGAAADLIQGGVGADTLNGGTGGDRMVGNPGNDVVNAGSGDDTLVWNNGDNTDDLNGEDGLDRIETNMGALGDAMTLAPVGGKVRFDRVNQVPFGLNIASSEVFELNGLGGDDTLTTAPGLGRLIAVVADAGSGNDTFTGSDETDTYFGGLGNDTLDPGPGIGDLVDGQDGDDTLNVRDNAADVARGGAGADRATADRGDVLVDVEKADVLAAPPAADTQGTAARVLSKRLKSKLKKGVYTAKIRVACPASEAGGCTGTLVLQTARTVSLGGTRFHAGLSSQRYSLKGGQTKTLKVKLAKSVSAVSRRGTLSLNAITTNRDAAGNLAQRSSRLAIKLVR
jgi:Ca2+-binding RTX toxin-like protein